MHIKPSPTLRTAALTTGASWRTTAITAALGALLATAHLNAQALALGPITSLSALGEPLVASISVPEINAEEFSSLKVTLATPDGFKAAGMEYNAALASAQFTLQRRPDGTTYLLLRSDKMVTDPFVNLVVTAKWSNGQIVRNYTLLLDPPAARQSEASTTTAPLMALPPAPARVATPAPPPRSEPVTAAAPAATPTPIPAPTPAAAARPAVEAKPSPVQAAKRPAATLSPTAASKNNGEQVKVAVGDTAGKIAANNRPANVSLDQMLIAMLRGNPDAFIGNNINRMKSGAVLSLPTGEEAQAIPDSTARQAVLAQSKDFNDFRRKLAENTPNIASKAPDRQAGGKVEAKVEDRKAATVTPDKLTLSKGSLNADPKATAKDAKDNSEKIAKERQAKDDAARVAELSKNITDLNKIAGATPVAPVKPAAGNAPAAPASAAAPATTTPTAAGKTAATVALTVPTTAVVAATTPTTPAATNPVPAATSPATPATTVTPAAATTAKATATATPNTPVAATPPATPAVPVKPVVVAKAPVPAPSFLDELMDNPAVLPAAGALLALLAVGGLYVARKRKSRAEEEDNDLDAEFDQSFFNTTSHTADVHEEVMMAPVAVAAQTTTIEPTLDMPTMPVAAETPAAVAPMAMPELPTLPVAQAAAPLAVPVQTEDTFPDFTPSEFSERTIAQLDPESAKSPASVDLDLDFDFAADFPAAAPSSSPAVAEVKPVAAPAAAVDHHALDFDMPSLSATGADAAVVAAAAATAAHASHTTATPPVTTPAASAVAATNPMAPLDFNMDSLSLDLNANNQQTSATAANAIGPLETKLALAQEFRAIGDATGAKMLAQEVIALASGSLKIKAETLLAEIG